MSLWVANFICETKIDDIDLVTVLPNAHQEVMRLDIAVDEIMRVNVLNSRDLNETEKMRGNIG
jgi:hypothetical protein